MTQEKLYLKRNVLVEPLFNRWFAWSYLISPATAAMYVTNSHLKIMRSFVEDPHLHVTALKNPAMIGGPFISYEANRVNEIRALIEITEKEQAQLLRFAEAVKGVNHLLVNDAGGYSLDPLYRKVPDVLKGYVELVYDLNNSPSIRFIEGLLYKSPYYNPSAQSIALSLVNGDDRPFFLSTPRLNDAGYLHLKMMFEDDRLDELFKMRYSPRPYGYIKDLLNVKDEDDGLFSTFFTEVEPEAISVYTGDAVRVRYFGHACVLVQSNGVSVLTDPVIGNKHQGCSPRYTYEDLPESIDYVLITHNHKDHLMFETLLQLRHKIKCLLVPKSGGVTLPDQSLKLVLQNIGFRNVREIDEMETVEIEGGAITGLPFLGEHGDLSIRAKVAYLVSLQGKSILFVADSNVIEPKLYERIHQLCGDVDVLFTGMESEGAPMSWLYGPLLIKPPVRKIDQSRRLNGSNCERGLELVRRFNPKRVYVYAMGLEPWLGHIMAINYSEHSPQLVESKKLVGHCMEHGIAAERLYCQKEFYLHE